jgi:RHS repeat-associated protein
VASESNSASGDRFKFTAREYDLSAGIYYSRARYYDPALGRFMSQDPSGFAAGDRNTYRYALGSPMDFADPSGLYSLRWCGAWNKEQKQRVIDAFAAIRARVNELLAMIDAELKAMNAAQREAAGPGLEKLREILSKIDKNMRNKKYVINVYHEKMGFRWNPELNKIATMAGDDNNKFFNPSLTLNDRLGSDRTNWENMPLDDFHKNMLHEISHLHGSDDPKEVTGRDGIRNVIFPPWYMEGENIGRLMNKGLRAIGEFNNLMLKNTVQTPK